ncbi:MBL fold metallo-hydrolase [Streptomyces sp. S6]
MTVTWEELGWERLSDRAGRIRLPGWDCTVGLVTAPGATLMIDAGSSLPEGTRLHTEATHLTGVNVTHLALTHAHFDHVLGAAAFPGAAVYAASAAYDAAELTDDAVRNGLARHLAEEATAALITPDHVVRDRLTLVLGESAPSKILLARLGPAHSPDDLVVLVPGTPDSPPILFCGDLVEESGEPQAGSDAVPGRWPEVLDVLLELGGQDALYVPGHGAVVDAEFVRRQRDALRERFGVSHG